jgi:hypothetical protein
VSIAQRPGGQRGARPKTGPAKPYTDEEIAAFAEFREQRATLAPRECNHGEVCWVAAGPPAISPSCTCLGCGGMPRPFNQRRDTRPQARKYPSHF